MSENTDQNPQTRLYAKLAEVIGEVGYLSKEGRNQFQNYDYTTAEQILGAIRGPLSQRKVVLMPSLTDVREREYETSKGKASVITTVRVTFTLIDSEDGGTHVCEWAGQGDDPGDKGLGKAYTNAIKTFLREQFLIPQGDDPEADVRTDERTAQRQSSRPRPSQPQPQAAPAQQTERAASAKQRSMIYARAKELQASALANAILEATGSEQRDWVSEDAALAWVNRSMERLPARFVDPLLSVVQREVEALPSVRSDSEPELAEPEPTIPMEMDAAS